MRRLSRRTIVGALALAGVLALCGTAFADNYAYKRTAADDAAAAAATLQKTDFPTQLRLTGGRVKPDETPNNDSCNGYRPKESDLVVSGDAETRFHDSTRSIVVDSQTELFRTTTMAATDVKRGQRMLTPACQAQAATQEHVKLVSYSVLGRPKCTCNFGVSVMFEAKTTHTGLDTLSILTVVRKGRVEASVITTVGKSTASTQSGENALQTALAVQGVAVKALFARLHAG